MTSIPGERDSPKEWCPPTSLAAAVRVSRELASPFPAYQLQGSAHLQVGILSFYGFAVGWNLQTALPRFRRLRLMTVLSFNVSVTTETPGQELGGSVTANFESFPAPGMRGNQHLGNVMDGMSGFRSPQTRGIARLRENESNAASNG